MRARRRNAAASRSTRMTLPTVVALAAAVFVLGVTPGPGVFAGVARALASGLGPAVAFATGMVVGDIVLLLLVVFGLAAVAETMGELFLFVKIAGGAYLVWLGLKLWRTKPVTTGAGAETERGFWRNSLGGFALTLGNPKAILFYAAFLPTFLDLARLDAAGILIAVAVVASVLFLVMLGYCSLAARARRLFQSQRSMRRLNRGAGALLMGAGVAVATR
jgi:threonine/homoserine/homoserine lactone efflux protein